MYSQVSQDAPDIQSDIMEYTLCGMDFGNMEAEERRLEEMRREERREQAIAWLREQKTSYIDTRRCPNRTKGSYTYKRPRARRRHS